MFHSRTIYGLVLSLMTLFSASASPALDDRDALNQVLSRSYAARESNVAALRELRLVNWNIAYGQRFPEILAAMQSSLQSDICVLQEVDQATRRSDYRDVADELARALQMNYAWGIEFQELAQGRKKIPAFTGQALLSRLPIIRSRILRFRNQLYNWGPRWKPRLASLQPRQGGRMALVSEFEWNGRACVIYNLHLESQASDKGRVKQIREILDDMIAHYPAETPVILAGDLNTRKGARSPVLQLLREARFQDALAAYSGPLGTKVGAKSQSKKDWIFVRHLRCQEGSIANIVASDHYPLTVRLSLMQ